MKDNYTYLTSKMDFSGFKTMTYDELLEVSQTCLYFSKGDLAKCTIPEGVIFDTALPLDWLNALCEFHGLSSEERDRFVATTFMLYSDARGINGFPWSPIEEYNKLIQEFINGGK